MLCPFTLMRIFLSV